MNMNSEKVNRYLDELADEYKKMLLQAVIEQSDSSEEISISTMLRLDNEVKKNLFVDHRKSVKKRKNLIAAGGMYVALGLFMLLYNEVLTQLDHATYEFFPLLSMIMTFSGILVCVTAYVLPNVMRRRDDSNKHEPTQEASLALYEYEVIKKWREIEGFVNELATYEGGKQPRSVLNFLEASGMIDQNEYETMKRFLQLRNEIVHSSELSISMKEMSELMKKVDTILNKFKELLN